jgi:hypothetical protein
MTTPAITQEKETAMSTTTRLAAPLLLALASTAYADDKAPTPAEARAIAKEAYVYGFPLVDNYRIMHSFFVEKGGKEYKGGWNQIHNEANVFTPKDRSIQTPNSDTPYSHIGTDLRAEPLVISLPAVEKGRYYTFQLIDLYTHNYAFISSRTTGNEAGSYLLAGPNWRGEKPEGIKAVIRCETEIGYILVRTQLYNAADIDNVRKIQAAYKLQPLSAFLGQPAKQAPAIGFIKPLTMEAQRTSLEFFNVLNFCLGFCPTHPSEKELMAKLARIDVGSGKTFDAGKLTPEIKKAIEEGMADAWKELAELKRTQIDTRKIGSGDVFGTREYLKNNYLYRMVGAVFGIYGQSKEEAIYPVLMVDGDGNPLDGSKHRYTLHFAPGEYPPVNAFWSLTLYELPDSFLYANPLNRYLINSPMLPELKKDEDGGLTLYVQHESPGKDKEANWLPAPKGPFVCFLRLYAPKEDAFNGKWKAPLLKKVK